jgi:hypothetical protein
MSMMLHSHGVDTPYDVRLGQFDSTDGKLDIALELEIADNKNEDAPPEILVRFTNLEFQANSKKLAVRDRHDDWGADDGKPHAYAYSGFHHTKVSGWINVLSHDETRLIAEIKVVIDDVDRYDESATDNALVGQCVLSVHPKNEMWGP